MFPARNRQETKFRNEFPPGVSGAQPSESRLDGSHVFEKRDGTSKNDNGRLRSCCTSWCHRAAPSSPVFFILSFSLQAVPRTHSRPSSPTPSQPSQPRPERTSTKLAQTFFRLERSPIASRIPSKWALNLKLRLPAATEFLHHKIPSSSRLLGKCTHPATPPFPSQSEFSSCTGLSCPRRALPSVESTESCERRIRPRPSKIPKKRPIHRLETTPRSPTKLLFWVSGSANRRCPGS
jgi:hypothetical protein